MTEHDCPEMMALGTVDGLSRAPNGRIHSPLHHRTIMTRVAGEDSREGATFNPPEATMRGG